MKSAIRLVDGRGREWFGVWTTSTSRGDVFGRLVRSVEDFLRHHPRYFAHYTSREEMDRDIARLCATGTDDEFLSMRDVRRLIRRRARGRKGPHLSAVDWLVRERAWPYDERPLVVSTSEMMTLIHRGAFPRPRPPTGERPVLGPCDLCQRPVYDDERDDFQADVTEIKWEDGEVELVVTHRDCELSRVVCLCTFCRGPIYEAQIRPDGPIADQHVYSSSGELKYVSLAHGWCAPATWARNEP